MLFRSLSFLLSFLAVALVRVPLISEDHAAHASSGVRAELIGGLRLVATNSVLRTLLITGFVLMLGFMFLFGYDGLVHLLPPGTLQPIDQRVVMLPFLGIAVLSWLSWIWRVFGRRRSDNAS